MAAYGTEELSDVVDHICIFVKDIDGAMEWYTKKLGFIVQGLNVTDGKPLCYHLFNGNLGIDLVQCGEGQNPGINHIAFRVEDVFKTAEVFKKRGIELVYEAFHQPMSGRDICQIYAPEGVQIQITRKLRRGDGEDLVVDKVLGKE